MNRTASRPKEVVFDPHLQTLALTAFVVESNLREVAKALGHWDRCGLEQAAARHEKVGRLRHEVEAELIPELEAGVIGGGGRLKVALHAVEVLAEIGDDTVVVAQTAIELLDQDKPSRTSDVRKLLEHAVYITDKAMVALADDRASSAEAALEQKRAADVLFQRISADLAERSDDRYAKLAELATLAHSACGKATGLAAAVLAMLNSVEL